MGRKLYIGNLPYHLSEAKVAALFSQIAMIDSVRIIFDSSTGQSRGYGFVEMSSEEAAQVAVEALNGLEIEGRKITVSIAKGPRPRPSATL